MVLALCWTLVVLAQAVHLKSKGPVQPEPVDEMTDGCRFADLAPLSADLEGTGRNQDYMIGDQLTHHIILMFAS